MKVVLLKDIPKVGKKNDVKEVSGGFARNFLFAQNLAKQATPEALKKLAEEKTKAENIVKEDKNRYSRLAEKLNLLTLHFKVKMEKGKAFGSISAARILDRLKHEGVEVSKDALELAEPIKSAGEHIVVIKLPHGLHGKIKVFIEPET